MMTKTNRRKRKVQAAKVVPKTRKELRKEKRLQKKENKNNYFSKKKPKLGQFVKPLKSAEGEHKNKKKILGFNSAADDSDIASDFELSDDELNQKFNKIPKQKQQQQLSKPKSQPTISIDRFHENQQREKKKHQELERKMRKRRIEQLKAANEEEDRIIRRLEKKLKIDKRKNGKNLHKMFSSDGLDDVLELCLPENIEKMYAAAKEAAGLQDDEEDDFEEDMTFALTRTKSNDAKGDLTAQEKKQKREKDAKDKLHKKNTKLRKIESKYFKDDCDSNSEFETKETVSGDDNSDVESECDSEHEGNSKNEDLESENEREGDDANSEASKDEQQYSGDDAMDSDEDGSEYASAEEFENKTKDEQNSYKNESVSEEEIESKENRTWEDIYGRKRDEQGNIIKETSSQKYIPPHARASLIVDDEECDSKRREKLENLRRSCKGFLNRLSESNMHKIATDIENLYMKNSRHDMNNTLCKLVTEALVIHVLSKERLVLEHAMLIAVLHANVGSEVGAHFLQVLVTKFNGMMKNVEQIEVEDKELDNIVFILSHFYTFKVFQHNLIFEIVHKLIEKLCEKTVECLLLILRSIGFQLRKDDPGALKDLILIIQKKAAEAPSDIKENPRLKFMLDILGAIKNNNVNKIPNYDPTLAEHLKKVIKSILVNGKYVATLNITLDDLLKADEKGKWWVVGSAWTGNIKDIGPANQLSATGNEKKTEEKFSEKLLELARKQRMNTEDRKNVFCILMSAEDYIDAFEKLMHLSIKDYRIVASILIHCCLSEKTFNPYYAVLAQKFSEYDRKYQLAIQFALWDRIKDINSATKVQIQNLAQFIIHLVINGGLPISVLKVVEFAELDKLTLRLVRQIVLGILLAKEDECKQVFERIAPSVKLNTFKDSIRLFMHHFLLKEGNKSNISPEQMELLRTRIALVDRILEFIGSRVKF